MFIGFAVFGRESGRQFLIVLSTQFLPYEWQHHKPDNSTRAATMKATTSIFFAFLLPSILFTLSRGPAYRLPMPLFYFSVQVIETSILITNEVLLLPGKESRLFLRLVLLQ
jgi:hypothetical protein